MNRIQQSLLSLRENHFNTSSLLYDTLSQLNSNSDFENFFNITFCRSTLMLDGITPNPYYTPINDCSINNSPYVDAGYFYISIINNGLIDDLLRSLS